MSAIAFSCTVLVFFIALQFSSYETSINASISVFSGHLQVQPDSYLDTPEMRKVLTNPEELRQEFVNLPEVKGSSIRAFGFALCSSEDRSYGVQVVGVDPEHEPDVSSISGVMQEGTYLSSRSKYETIIGKALSENLKVKVSDELTLLGQAKDGSVAATVVEVKGIFKSGAQELDRHLIQLPLKIFQEVFSMDNTAHAVVITAKSLKDVPKIKKAGAEILNAYNNAKIKPVLHDWDELNPGMKQAIQLDMAFGWIFYFSLVVVVTFTVLNTFLMSILERTREFGVMLSLGMKPADISKLVTWESFFLTLVGLIIGTIIGSAIVIYFGVYGFYIPGTEEIAKLWNIPAVFRPRLSALTLTIGPGIIIIVTVIALIYPIIKLRALKPVEALRAV